MSASYTRAKPSIAEPSKPIPSANAPSSSAGATATDFSVPSTSVHQSRTNLMSRSSSVRSTNSSCLSTATTLDVPWCPTIRCESAWLLFRRGYKGYGSTFPPAHPRLEGVTKLRIALAQVNATVGDLDGNAGLIVGWTGRAAERGARVVVFPEMMLTGYPVEDLALRASFVEASIATLHVLAARLSKEGLGGIAVVTGYLDRRTDLAARTGLPAGAPQDAAALLYGGRVVLPSASHHLPTYGAFGDFRYFVPGDTLPVFRVPTADGASV